MLARICSFSTRCVFLFNVTAIFLLILLCFKLDDKIVQLSHQTRDSARQTHQVVVYNRVPKTGSTSFVGLAYDLCATNHFRVLHINVSRNANLLSLSDQDRFVRNISTWNTERPAFFHGHLAYLDFSRFSVSHPPIYINLIRRPLDRLVSYYYFLRFGDDFRPHLVRRKQGDKMTFDECVKEGRPECHPDNTWLQVPYFCGQHADCWIPGSQWALEQAKRNLVDKYLVVGVTEQMEDFVAVLESALPCFFRGALDLYRQGSKSHLRKTNKKRAPRAETVQRFHNSSAWQLEDQFYEFALRQFESVKARTLDAATRHDKGQQFFYEKIRPK